jgi:hypothetical protein
VSNKRIVHAKAVVRSWAFGNRIDLYVVAEELVKGREPDRYYVGIDGWSNVGNGDSVDPITITPQIAQELVDSLWEVGVRPYAAQGSAGQLSAVENHLSDMRRIAFKGLEMEVGK